MPKTDYPIQWKNQVDYNYSQQSFMKAIFNLHVHPMSILDEISANMFDA
jgi:hypothetical protein